MLTINTPQPYDVQPSGTTFNDAIIYDSQMDAADDAELSTEIGGGSIVIHTRDKK